MISNRWKWRIAVLSGILVFCSGIALAKGAVGKGFPTEAPSDTTQETVSDSPNERQDSTAVKESDKKRDKASNGYRNSYQNGYNAGYEAGYRIGYQAGTQYRSNHATNTRYADGSIAIRRDSLAPQRRFMHRIGGEFCPEYIFPTNPFLAGENQAGKPIQVSLSGHLRYSFQYRPGSVPDRIYGGAYQGIGVAYYDFQTPDELGNPMAVYLFQGARIARLGQRLSFNYEWNFGLSFGWKPYDGETNTYNKMMGSKVNAYLNTNFFFNWMVTREVDLSAGFSLTHFSNGNTKFPNAGLNAVGLRAGLTYNFGRKSAEITPRTVCPAFPRHVSYDLTLFGSWRRKGIEIDGKQYAAPDAYTVVGFNFASMYNFGYKFRAGVSLDGVYDGSANVYLADQIVSMGSSADLIVEDPGFDKQIALGLSARAEFVMPYFNIGIGLGTNVLHKGGDLKAFYQMLTLKVAVTRSSYIHIGYCLRDFHMPNFLMLGVGYRFNNKYPRHR